MSKEFSSNKMTFQMWLFDLSTLKTLRGSSRAPNVMTEQIGIVE